MRRTDCVCCCTPESTGVMRGVTTDPNERGATVARRLNMVKKICIIQFASVKNVVVVLDRWMGQHDVDIRFVERNDVVERKKATE